MNRENRSRCITLSISAVMVSTSLVGVAGTPIALLKVSDGVVYISGGSQTLAARDGMELNADDRIFVLEDSSATIEFVNGGQQTVPENTLLRINYPETSKDGATVEGATVESEPSFDSAATAQMPLSEPTDDHLYAARSSSLADGSETLKRGDYIYDHGERDYYQVYHVCPPISPQ